LPKVRFFDMLNRWETVLAVLILIVVINAGLFFFLYLPRLADPPAAPWEPPENTERTTLTTPPLENTAPKTTLEITSATAGRSACLSKRS
jgi:hypothetical protein